MNKLVVIAAAFAVLSVSCASSPSAPASETSERTGAQAAAEANQAKPIDAESQAAEQKKTPRVVVVRIPLETKASIWFADGSLDETILSDRDPAGLLLSQTRLSASGSVVEKIAFDYRDGKPATRTTTDGEGKTVTRKIYAYNQSGSVVSESLEDAAGKRLSSFEYSYDEKGKRLVWLVKDSKGSPIAETVYGYKDGVLLTAELRDGIGRKTGSSAYEYDADGHLIKQSFYDMSGKLVRTETNLWTNGELVQEDRKSPSGTLLQRTVYEYGADGEQLTKSFEDLVGKSKLMTTYEYSFREERKTIAE